MLTFQRQTRNVTMASMIMSCSQDTSHIILFFGFERFFFSTPPTYIGYLTCCATLADGDVYSRNQSTIGSGNS